MRRTALTTPDMDLEADLIAPLAHVQADIVDTDGGAVMLGCGHGDLELARQEGKFRMERAPLTDDLAPWARVHDLVFCSARIMVAGRVADTIAAGLDGMHLDLGQLCQNVGNILQRDPVELDVLARGEVAIAAVILARDLAQLAQLATGQLTIGNRDPQHIGVQLEIDPVLQSQRLELVLEDIARQSAGHLSAKLLDPVAHDLRVKFIIPVHQ